MLDDLLETGSLHLDGPGLSWTSEGCTSFTKLKPLRREVQEQYLVQVGMLLQLWTGTTAVIIQTRSACSRCLIP